MAQKLAVLLSGGKDSLYAAYLAKEKGYELACAITLLSENKESYMFHTPSILQTVKQVQKMEIPHLLQKTSGEKEKELLDLTAAIQKAREKYGITGIVSGAIQSAYQAGRLQKICHEQELLCFNPLWQKPQYELLLELLTEGFEVMITGVFAYPLDETYLGRKLDKELAAELLRLQNKYQINPAGEGGEFETFVLNCPLFREPLKVQDSITYGEGNAWRMEVEIA